MDLDITINGEEMRLQFDPGETLLDLLRRHGYKSVKKGCGSGDCGACTVLLDGEVVASCILLAGQCQGRSVVTVEGIGTPTEPHEIQRAFVEVGAVQCGYCTPGMVLSAKALLDKNPEPNEEEILEALDGVKCRCTGYVKQVDAVKLAAKMLRGDGP